MNEHKHFHLSAKTYYSLLILCAAVIGIAGFLFQKNVTVKKAAVAPVSLEETETVSVMAPQSLAVQPVKETQPETVPETVHRGIQTASPVDGASIADYAMEVLSYNETTRDWRTHDGIDLAAPEGGKVLAAAEGTVQSVFEDDAMGLTVVLRHGDGYVSRYSCLGSTCVAEGDYLYLSQPLGTVGESATVESTIGTHVHFAVSRDGQSMDPNEFLALE